MTEQKMQELVDRSDIREVARRYCRGVDRLDGELMKSAYWPDAVDEHGVFNGNAHEFVDHCMVSHRRWASTLHCIFNHTIELDASRGMANGEIYNVTYLFSEGESAGVDLWVGRYLDTYEKRGKEWRIIKRVCVHEGSQHLDGAPMSIDSSKFVQGSADRNL